MAYLVIAYPNVSESDYSWIQGIRQKHDPQFDLVKPHVTLVFGTDKLSQVEFIEHVRNSLAESKSFPITLDSAKVIQDGTKNLFHTFLVPSEGFNEIDKLHDHLYQDALKSELRTDIPFVPHLTIGSGSEAKMKALANHINSQSISIKGHLNKVSIVEFDNSTVHDVASVSLI